MTTYDDLLVAAGHSVDSGRWLGILDEPMLRVGARFRRVEPRRRARAFVLGLLAGLPRKNCWTLAVQAGEASPDGMQHLLHDGGQRRPAPVPGRQEGWPHLDATAHLAPMDQLGVAAAMLPLS